MDPVVYRRGRQIKPQPGEHLDLPVLGQMVVELVVDECCQQVGSDMAASYDAVRAWSLYYPGRRGVFVTLEPQYRRDGLFHQRRCGSRWSTLVSSCPMTSYLPRSIPSG